MARKRNKMEKMQKEMKDTADMMAKDQEREHEMDVSSQNEAGNEQVDTIEKLQLEVQDWKDKYLRSMAEFENYRRRSQQEKADWIRLATEKLALSICDVLDNFERALSQIGDDHREDSFVKGFFLIEQQLKNVLEKEGVKRIEALNMEFDPKFHEALAHIPSDLEENMVTAIIQNGYTMYDKVIRPVRVAVSNGKNNENKND